MKIDFAKYPDGLVPAIVQDYKTQKVLMLGFMNEESFKKTEESGMVTFYSRSKKRLWTKGEESGHHLMVRQVLSDCDHDTLLIKADPQGPVCHTGADTCWSEKKTIQKTFYFTWKTLLISGVKPLPKNLMFPNCLLRVLIKLHRKLEKRQLSW